MLDLEAPLREFEREYTNGEPTPDATRGVAPHIATLWKAVSQAPKAGAHEAQVTHSLAVLAAACAAAAKSPDLAQADRVGALIREVLLFASTHTDPGFDATGAERFNESQGWGSPAVRIEAAAGLLALAREATFADTSVQEAIRRLAADEVPPVRYQVASRLTLLYRSASDLMWELLERSMADEHNRGVLHGTLAAASRLSGRHSDRLVPLLLSVLDRVAEGAGADQVREDVSSILFGLTVWQGRADCQAKLDELVDDLPRNHYLLSQLVANERELLTHGPADPPDPEQDAVRHRGLAFLRSLLSAARTTIEDANARYGAAGGGLLAESDATRVRAPGRSPTKSRPVFTSPLGLTTNGVLPLAIDRRRGNRTRHSAGFTKKAATSSTRSAGSGPRRSSTTSSRRWSTSFRSIPGAYSGALQPRCGQASEAAINTSPKRFS